MRETILSTFDPDRGFITLNHSIKKREEKQLKFAKCPYCGRLTPYRLSSLKGKSLICKACKKPLSLTRL